MTSIKLITVFYLEALSFVYEKKYRVTCYKNKSAYFPSGFKIGGVRLQTTADRKHSIHVSYIVDVFTVIFKCYLKVANSNKLFLSVRFVH